MTKRSRKKTLVPVVKPPREDRYVRISMAIPREEVEVLAWLQAPGKVSRNARIINLIRADIDGESVDDKLDQILKKLDSFALTGFYTETKETLGASTDVPSFILGNIMQELDDD